MKKWILGTIGLTLAVGITGGLAAAPAQAAWPFHDYWGPNRCSGSKPNPTLQTQNTGNLEHDIFASTGYFSWTYSNGASNQLQTSASPSAYAPEATLGYDTSYSPPGHWYCSNL